MALVEISVEERIGFITLNRPEKRNALSPEMVTELKSAFAKMESDDAVKIIVLRANGEVFAPVPIFNTFRIFRDSLTRKSGRLKAP